MFYDGSVITSAGCPSTKDMVGRGGDLVSCEAELTREVPNLFEAMNKAATEVNHYKGQLSEAQERHRQNLDQWSRLYENLRVEYGSSIDRAKPYFDAVQALDAASHKVQKAVREFSAAVSHHSQAKEELRRIEERLAYGAHKMSLNQQQQDGLSKATVNVLRCQQERDRSEQEYARALRECQEVQKTVETRRAQIGHAVIARATPCFRRLQQHQLTLVTEQARIAALEERVRSCKGAYSSSMRELDRISCAVHSLREAASDSQALCSVASVTVKCIEEAPPEVTQITREEHRPEMTSTPPELVDNDEMFIKSRVHEMFRTAPPDPVDDSPFS